jgi:hypothetical protein
MKNRVVVEPLSGEIEQEPFSGDGLILKFNALELISIGKE